jgi:hypothetical protein
MHGRRNTLSGKLPSRNFFNRRFRGCAGSCGFDGNTGCPAISCWLLHGGYFGSPNGIRGATNDTAQSATRLACHRLQGSAAYGRNGEVSWRLLFIRGSHGTFPSAKANDTRPADLKQQFGGCCDWHLNCRCGLDKPPNRPRTVGEPATLVVRVARTAGMQQAANHQHEQQRHCDERDGVAGFHIVSAGQPRPSGFAGRESKPAASRSVLAKCQDGVDSGRTPRGYPTCHAGNDYQCKHGYSERKRVAGGNLVEQLR